MRLIDADALNERIKSKMFELQNAIEYRFRERGDVKGKDRLLLEKYGFASQLIGEQPTISQWIPVSERLPDNAAEVLIQDFDGFYALGWVDNDGDGWWGDEGFLCGYDEIIAWMPLPEPYKKGDNNER